MKLGNLFSPEEVCRFTFNGELKYILEDLKKQLIPIFDEKVTIKSAPVTGLKYTSIHIYCTVLDNVEFSKSYFQNKFEVCIKNKTIHIQTKQEKYTFASNNILTIIHRFKNLK